MDVSFSFAGISRSAARKRENMPRSLWRTRYMEFGLIGPCPFFMTADSEVLFFHLFGLAWQELNQSWETTYLRSPFEFTRNRPDKDARDTFEHFGSFQPSDC